MNNSIYNQLTANLELLKLSQMKLHLDEIRDFVTNNGLSFTEGLLKLSNYEVDFKEQSASRSMIKAAAFPFVKELKDFDFEFQPSVNEHEMRELTNLGEDSNLFFQLTDMRYEKKSTILTTNMNFNEWDGVFYDAIVANVIMDRILHHAHVIPISGKSYRLKDHLKAAD